MNADLMKPYTREEVHAAIKQMAPSKAAGTDGMPPLFYQAFWQNVGPDISEAVLSCLNTSTLLKSIDHTFITLIPKVCNLENVSEFRPIGLCNVPYKIISKVIANRLKPLLNSIISEAQSAFTADRLITDNILIAFGSLHYMKTQCSGKEGFMALKLDMSKAYDRVEWKFWRKSSCKWVSKIHGSNAAQCSKIQQILEWYEVALGQQKKACSNQIKERIWNKMQGWKEKLLSQAGNEVMIKAVIQSIPTYSMSVFQLPIGLIKDIEAMICKFWHILPDNSCNLCEDHLEDVLHCLWLCDYAKCVWLSDQTFSFPCSRVFRSFGDLVSFILTKTSSNTAALFSMIAWSIWTRCNKLQVKQQVWDVGYTVKKAKELLQEFRDV
ncbi:uncharacterized protein LOC142635149 [Castanea sativa]|uniref:uncharacterized protein LOC142635149 n=1 Tax=Castanea sativa TaxID=21020 RepID=UPI003F6497CE